MNPSKSSGFTLVIAVVMIFFTALCTGSLGYILTLHQKEAFYYYAHLKSRWLALSGIEVSRSLFNDLPVISEPATKDRCYQTLSSFRVVSIDAETDIFLAKSSTAVYSIGRFKKNYRTLFKRYYNLDENQQLIWKQYERL